MQISSNYSMNGVPYETGSVYFRPSTGICSEKHRGSEGLYEKKTPKKIGVFSYLAYI